MMDQPSTLELVKAVQSFIETKAMPELKGHTAFHARIAANALGIVARELELGPRATEMENAQLSVLLNQDGSLEELNRELCKRIREGKIDIQSDALRQHLELTTLDKVAIDQPNYSGLKIARSR
ncbi:MAG TPA: DUF6285 domain-containing protein [Rhizomicrobium sp.]|nr:DUF6285 domain-containing protein [Rhizomicrobium sp.]